MNPPSKRTILLMGSDANLGYLLNRFAEQSEYQLTIAPETISHQEVTAANHAAIIFSSMDFLDKAHTLVAELNSLEVPVIVCSGVVDQVRARELGADSCLFHPITLEGFRDALASVSAPRSA